MKYYSTNNKNEFVDFKTAVMSGLASDGGLFLPDRIPPLSKSFLDELSNLSTIEIAVNIADKFIDDEIENNTLQKIIEQSITFPSPLVELNESFSILELFHGPTLAFKDFGARFMARTMEHFIKDENEELNILVATSGDTGSAVANGFLGVEGINVFVLYPSGKVSKIQEQQFTTLGNNIKAIEIEGTFDDCQKIVKQAFVDKEIIGRKKMSSANSINIARLIPQTFYYFDAFKQNREKDNLIFCVPSGNFGNLTAGLFAKKMGLPVNKFIAATNSNDIFPKYLSSGIFHPKPSKKTYSNAMDVGNPSNLSRIIDLFNNDLDEIKSVIYSNTFSDEETLSAIAEVRNEFEYVIDPHGAVGYLAALDYKKNVTDSSRIIILETAHAAKFADVVEKAIGEKVIIPVRLEECMHKEKQSIMISNDYNEFKNYFIHS
ncbi:MAG: threonine synthase [Ignavibacteriae bacterium]|nr:threonine synthase [Ignavibacteriota bacterium]NOG99828.1 threonine synthase [Ignavibacteriota bacterium]